MDATSKRWTEVTPSPNPHEVAALELVRRLLPDIAPYAAWSNFSFLSTSGAVREVDLLVLTRIGPVLLELKHWRGVLTTRPGSGVWLTRQGGREQARDNPLILVNQKAKELKSVIERAARRDAGHRGAVRLPYFRAAVFFSDPTMTCTLPDDDRHHLYGPPRDPGSGGLPGVDTLLTSTAGQPLDPEVARSFHLLMTMAGITRTRSAMRVGEWELDPRPFDEGPTWQDYHATRLSRPTDYRRVRI